MNEIRMKYELKEISPDVVLYDVMIFPRRLCGAAERRAGGEDGAADELPECAHRLPGPLHRPLRFHGDGGAALDLQRHRRHLPLPLAGGDGERPFWICINKENKMVT